MKLTKKVAIVCLALACSTITFGAELQAKAVIKINNKTVSSNESSYIENGTTMVPLRVIAETLEAKVNYDKTTEKIIILKNDIVIEMKIDSYTVKVNDITTMLNMSPTIKNGTTMVPIRFITECFLCDVDYNKSQNLISINNGSEEINAKNVLARLTPAKTDQFDRVIRTTNLPKNAKYFPYIAADVPNWCYEQQPWDDNYWGSHRVNNGIPNASKVTSTPKMVSEVGNEQSRVLEDNWDDINAFLESALNVDYRTLDEKTYINNVAGMTCLKSTSFKSQAAMNLYAKEYVDYYKKAKVIIDTDFQVLPETAWVSTGLPSMLNFSVYVKMTPKQITGDIYDTWGLMSVYSMNFNSKVIKSNQTLEGILTYTLIKQSDGNWKLNYMNMSPLAQLYPQCDILNGIAPDKKDTKNREDKFNYTWTRDKNVYYTRYDKNTKRAN